MFAALQRFDDYLSKSLAVCATESSTFGSLRWVMMLLEWSGQEVFWYPLMLILIAAAVPHRIPDTIEIGKDENTLHQELPVFLAVFCGLCLDSIAVSVLKVAVKRPRPKVNKTDMHTLCLDIDKFSFPSGHTSRMVFLGVFTCTIKFDILYNNLYAWPVFVCVFFLATLAMSRVFLGRHFPSDIVGGAILGIINAQFVLYNVVHLLESNRHSIASSLFAAKVLVVFFFDFLVRFSSVLISSTIIFCVFLTIIRCGPLC